MDCPRKWGFQKIDELPDDPGHGAIFGGAVHAVAEAVLRDGLKPEQVSTGRVLKVAKALLAAYPPIPAERLVEEEFWIPRSTWQYHGIVDLVHEHEENPNWLVINDHKTSKDPQRWGLTTKTLPRDRQALIYAAYGYEIAGAERVFNRWMYVNTVGTPRPFPVMVSMAREYVAEAMETYIDPIAARIADARMTTRTAIDLPYDKTEKACAKYKGCPYASYCPREPRAFLDLMMDDGSPESQTDERIVPAMGLIAKMKNKKKAPPRPEELPPDKNPKGAGKGRASLRDRVGKKRKPPKKEEAEDVEDVEEETEEETEERSVNAPEVDDGDDRKAVEMSKRIGEGKNADEESAEVAAKNAEKAEALDAGDVMKALTAEEGEMVFSVSRAKEQFPYVKPSTLESLRAAGKIDWYKDGQKAFVSFPDNKPIHAKAWTDFVCAALQGDCEDPIEIADTCLEGWRERFG